MEKKEPHKILVKKTVLQCSQQEPFKWSDIKHFEFQDNDEIHLEFVESHFSENNSWDEHFSCTVIRNVLETDEEFEERQRRIERDQKWAKEERYKRYLKLKEEFEPTFKHSS